ncbi:MAG: glycosyltransferase family A protein [Candidatus Omnitrophota bacterium]
MMRYIIISPVRNEEKYIDKTIQSVIVQTLLPKEWVIVNDGSTDKTKEIISRYIDKYPWIRIIDKKDRGFTQVGKGVIEAFYEGYRNIISDDWDYIVKLDCDISIENNFFEKLINRFMGNKDLCISGGTSYTFENNKYHEEKMPDFHPWAGARIYRKKCFIAIGGLVENLGWDTIDLLRAQMKNWKTKRFDDLKIIHHRRMSSRKGLWEGKIRTGRNFYITGYHPLFLVVRNIYRLKEKPYFIESIGVTWGYLQAMYRRESLVVNKQEKAFLHKQQIRRLVGLKV